jgi:3',5'-cyclic AMP phosphodiesterase CpdA
MDWNGGGTAVKFALSRAASALLAVLSALGAIVLAFPALAGDREDALSIILLGDSRTDGCVGQPSRSECRRSDSGFNEPVLSSLLAFAGAKRPDAVFFTGDLTLGLEKEEEDGAIDEGASPASGGWSRDFQYDPKTFTRMLASFKRIVTKRLRGVPFYPVVGNHDTVGPDAVEIFRKTFALERPPSAFRDSAHLAYTIELRGTVFVVIATDYYQPCTERGAAVTPCNVRDHRISHSQLEWLDAQLAKHAGKRLFVLGHEPAFSSGTAKLGLDHYEEARDAFWKILKSRGVIAYLCSHQHQFAVSQHEGVWQLISGGAGAPLDGSLKAERGAPLEQCTGGVPLRPGFSDRSFFHYLVLRVPATTGRPVGVEVRDCRDTVRQTFELTAAQ